MTSGLLIQYLVVAGAVALSIWRVGQERFPEHLRRLRIVLALPLLREGRSSIVLSLGRWLAPQPSVGGLGCGSCHGCEPGST